ncbi:ultraviolet-B receptor UVR8-like [Zingiber officinale]|uniref:ultraviolet-B receptor UVR8-like n=1 Tax=Zingiber officinale TaxID=94328 RepID=UPI001C4B7F5E|nr:ultraviolet-B receptor UVR8-like [Zingiber officinale]XP_042421250.1 ultraviolet-B receptor UVR8-like [Zingiber officinale]XP_042421288.1 ultraviolet-B receptor UVR8-like [Zingiber officinale]XP_042421289.1 ultraviolet-B receptor UVR8-like [Zingiber officinale]
MRCASAYFRSHFSASSHSDLLRSLDGGGARRAASVWSFGDNSNGALGIATPLADGYEPTRVPSLPSDVTSVAAGHYHSLAVTARGDLWAWGRNEEGQLGRHAAAHRVTWSQPEKVAGVDHVGVTAAFASGVVSAAIDDEGSLWVWGRSKRGQLGLGNGVIEATKPSKVEALAGHQLVKVSFGWGHALALTKSGKVFGWGYAKDGRLGQMGQKLYVAHEPLKHDRSLESSTSMLDAVEKLVAEKIEEEKSMPIIWEPCEILDMGDSSASDVACGLDHSLVLSSNSSILSGGDNTYGQLGRSTGEGSVMLPVDTNTLSLSVSAGLGHSLAICHTSSGACTSVLSWGWNRSHQLGRRGREDAPGIIKALNGETPTSVSAGRVHSLALTAKKELWLWGSGRNGRLGLGSSLDETEPAMVESLAGLDILQAVAGFDHNLVLVS